VCRERETEVKRGGREAVQLVVVYAAFSYSCMRPSATRVCGLQLLVYVAFTIKALLRRERRNYFNPFRP
jgi:hypothetical protein